MTTQYKLNPENYKVENATITKAEIGEQYGMKYLSVTLEYESGGMQGYPAWNLRENLEPAIDNFIDFLQVSSLKEAQDKKVYALASQGDVFALFNTKTHQFFSLQARFHPELYTDAYAKILEDNPNLNVNHLDATESLLVAFIATMPVKDELGQKMNTIAHNYIQYKHLSDTIPDKPSQNQIKKKI